MEEGRVGMKKKYNIRSQLLNGIGGSQEIQQDYLTIIISPFNVYYCDFFPLRNRKTFKKKAL